MPLDLSYASAVLRSEYKAKWVRTYNSTNELEAEVSLAQENGESLLIEIYVDNVSIKATSIYLMRTPTKALDPLHFEPSTDRYENDPCVARYLAKIKDDIASKQ